eukprot:122867_1
MGNANSINSIPINVDILGHVKDKLVIHSAYEKEQKMKQIFNKITNHLNTKYDPIKYEIDWIKSGFTGSTRNIKSRSTRNIQVLEKSITEYDVNEIKNKGLMVHVTPIYTHQVNNVLISCPEMKRFDCTDAMKCSVYRKMKESYKYCAENLYHLEEYTHFTDEYGAKTVC